MAYYYGQQPASGVAAVQGVFVPPGSRSGSSGSSSRYCSSTSGDGAATASSGPRRQPSSRRYAAAAERQKGACGAELPNRDFAVKKYFFEAERLDDMQRGASSGRSRSSGRSSRGPAVTYTVSYKNYPAVCYDEHVPALAADFHHQRPQPEFAFFAE